MQNKSIEQDISCKLKNMQNKSIEQDISCKLNNEMSKQHHSVQAKKLFNEIDKFQNKMDDANKRAYNILKSEGVSSSVEHMFKHPETGEKMDYATMRYYYG